MNNFLDSRYLKDELAICPCANNTYLPKNAIPGRDSKCACGNGYAIAADYWEKFATKAKETERIALEEKALKECFPEAKPDHIKPAVFAVFKELVLPAFIDIGKTKYWKKSVLGETPEEAMDVYQEHYVDIADHKDKTASLDKFRKQGNSKDIIVALVAEVERMANA